MKSDAAYQYAWEHADRNPDDSRVHERMVDLVAEHVDFDVTKAKRGLARRIIARRMRPGQTAPEGAVVFPSMEHYAWEPDRLIADDKGNVIRNAEAKVDYKISESERAQADLEKAVQRQSREKREADHFSRWAVQQLASGRPPAEVTWEACVRETGLWKDQTPDDEDEQGIEDDDAEDGAS